jgi:hypothetical protein
MGVEQKKIVFKFNRLNHEMAEFFFFKRIDYSYKMNKKEVKALSDIDYPHFLLF